MNVPPPGPDRLSAENPWPGLRAFTEDDGGYFFGRETETDELLALIRRTDVSVLFGQSGLGKTSLLQAGVFPKLRALDFLPVRLRLDHAETADSFASQVKAALVAGLVRAGVTALHPKDDETLWEYFHRRDVDLWGPRNRLLTPVIVLDQFEEVFTLGQRNEATAGRVAAFLVELESLVEQRPPAAVRERLEAHPEEVLRYDLERIGLKLVICLREDFLPHLDAWRVRMPTLLPHRMRLEPLTGAQALTVVQQAGGPLVEPVVARSIVDFVSTSRRKRGLVRAMEDREVEPALLSLICDELNHRRLAQGQPRITAALLTGEREAITQAFYERAFAGVDDRARDWVEDELLTASGFRDRAALEDALKLGIPEAAFVQLVDRRLLHREEREGVVWVELTHDLLTDVADQSRRLRDQRRQAAQAAAREAEITRRLRQSRRTIAVFAALLFVAAAALVYALAMRTRAEGLRRQAELTTRQLLDEKEAGARIAREKEAETVRAASADRQLKEAEAAETLRKINEEVSGFWKQEDPMNRFGLPGWGEAGGLPVLASLVRRVPGNREVAALLLSQLNQRQFALPTGPPLETRAAPLEMAISPKEHWMAIRTSNQVLLADFPEHRGGFVPLPMTGVPVAMVFDEADRQLAVSTADGVTRIFSTTRLQDSVELKGSVRSVRFTADGRFLLGAAGAGPMAASSPTNPLPVALWSAESGEALQRFDPPVVPGSLAASADGTRVAGLAARDEVVVWDSTTAQPRWRRTSSLRPAVVRFVMGGSNLLVLGQATNAPSRGIGRPPTRRQPFELLEATTGQSASGHLIGGAGQLSDRPWNERASLYRSRDTVRVSVADHGATEEVRFAGKGVTAVSRSGRWFALETGSGAIWTYDNRPGSMQAMRLMSLDDPERGFLRHQPLQLSADSTRLLVAWRTGVAVFSVPDFERITDFAVGAGTEIAECRFLPEGGGALLAFADGSTRVCSFSGPKASLLPAIPGPTAISVRNVSGDGRRVMLVGTNGSVAVVDLQTGKQVGPALDSLRVATAPGSDVAGEEGQGPLMSSRPVCDLSSDGRLIFFTEEQTNGVLVSVEDARRVGKKLPHSSAVVWAGFSGPEGSLLTLTTNRELTLWDMSTWSPKLPPITLPQQVLDFGWSPTGERLAAVAADRLSTHEVWVWNARNGMFQGKFGVGFGLPEWVGIRWLDDRLLALSGSAQGALLSAEHLTSLDRTAISSGPAVITRDGRWWIGVESASALVRELPLLPSPVPAWLPELAEALAGESIRSTGDRVPVPSVAVQTLRDRVLATTVQDEWHKWARWFFADRDRRPCSPNAIEPLVRVERRREDGHDASWEADASKLAGMAVERLRDGGGFRGFADPGAEDSDVAGCLELLERAATINPAEPELWVTRASIWKRLGNRAEEERALDRCLSLMTNRADLWVQKLELLAASGRMSESPGPEARLDALLPNLPEARERHGLESRVITALRRMGRYRDAADRVNRWLGIAPRSASMPAEALDLGPFYTASLRENWFRLGEDRKPGELEAILAWTNRLAGVAFDLRGVVQLSDASLRWTRSPYPQKVTGIPVGRPARRLQFLHSAFAISTAAGQPIGEYVIHYASGGEHVAPIRPGIEVSDAYFSGTGDHTVAWPPSDWPALKKDASPKLYLMTWVNPRPDQVIASIDFGIVRNQAEWPVGGSWNTAPFLIAITAEP